MSIVDAVIEMLKDLEKRCPRCGDDVPTLAPPAQVSPKIIRDEAIVSDEERVDAWLADFNSGGWVDERVENLRPALLELVRAVRAAAAAAERERCVMDLELYQAEQRAEVDRLEANRCSFMTPPHRARFKAAEELIARIRQRPPQPQT